MPKVVISLRIDEQQRSAWRAAATAAGLDLTSYIVLRVEGKPAEVTPVPPPPATSRRRRLAPK